MTVDEATMELLRGLREDVRDSRREMNEGFDRVDVSMRDQASVMREHTADDSRNFLDLRKESQAIRNEVASLRVGAAASQAKIDVIEEKTGRHQVAPPRHSWPPWGKAFTAGLISGAKKVGPWVAMYAALMLSHRFGCATPPAESASWAAPRSPTAYPAPAPIEKPPLVPGKDPTGHAP